MSNKIIRLPEVLNRTGVSRATIYSWIKQENFPRPTKLCAEGRAVGWVSNQIDAWLEQRITASRQDGGTHE